MGAPRRPPLRRRTPPPPTHHLVAPRPRTRHQPLDQHRRPRPQPHPGERGMSLALTDIPSPPQPPIDRWGRYLLPGPDGEPRPHTRATTIAKTIADTTALEKWKMRMVAAGIGRRQELYALASSHDPETNRKVIEEITDKAMEAARS